MVRLLGEYDIMAIWNEQQIKNLEKYPDLELTPDWYQKLCDEFNSLFAKKVFFLGYYVQGIPLKISIDEEKTLTSTNWVATLKSDTSIILERNIYLKGKPSIERAISDLKIDLTMAILTGDRDVETKRIIDEVFDRLLAEYRDTEGGIEL